MDKTNHLEADESKLKEQINLISRQTNYSEKEIREKLVEYNYDPILVIKKYLGIQEKSKEIVSVNQEIYKQLRNKMTSVMLEYNVRKEENP